MQGLKNRRKNASTGNLLIRALTWEAVRARYGGDKQRFMERLLFAYVLAERWIVLGFILLHEVT